MSLWLEAATNALHDGDYNQFQHILPIAPIPIPSCLLREVEFAIRRCQPNTSDRLFPIRFLWLMEAHEQQLFGLRALGRSRYHPEKLLNLWELACTNPEYRKERESEGFLFDLAEKAIESSSGWIYIGERFVEDFLEVEKILGTELMFPGLEGDATSPAFQKFKLQGALGNEHVKRRNVPRSPNG